MDCARGRCRVACSTLLAFVCSVLLTPSVRGQLRPNPAALADAPEELVERLRADPLTYFRFINRAWIARVCQAFADVHDGPVVRLHGDAHVEQFAVTKDAWGLDDFDDSARGPGFVDIVRFMGSLDLATRQRGWVGERDAVWNRFLEGYRRGLANPNYRPSEPGIVRVLRAEAPATRAAFLAWGETQMRPMEEASSKSIVASMEIFQRFMLRERPDLPPHFFTVVRVGWLRIGVGSAVAKKVLVRVQGFTTDPEDDVLLEGKEAANLDGLGCLEGSTAPPAARIIAGTRQLGRLKHNILAVGPPLVAPSSADHGERNVEWWVSSWDPSYHEVRVSDLRSVGDLADIAYDSGVQLGAGELRERSARMQARASVVKLEARLKKETAAIVEELLSGWREIAGR